MFVFEQSQEAQEPRESDAKKTTERRLVSVAFLPSPVRCSRPLRTVARQAPLFVGFSGHEHWGAAMAIAFSGHEHWGAAMAIAYSEHEHWGPPWPSPSPGTNTGGPPWPSPSPGTNTGGDPRDLPNPGTEPAPPVSPALAGGFFTPEPPGESVILKELKLNDALKFLRSSWRVYKEICSVQGNTVKKN